MSERHIEGADGLRGLACLLVLLVHTVMITFPGTFEYLSGCGKIGVWLFFVLSAFLLTYQLERRGFGFAALADYAGGRFLRIIPAFAVVLVFYHFFGTANLDTWADAKAALFFQRGYAHLWTIPVEFKAYAFIPVFAAAFLAIRSFGGATGVLVGLLLAIAIHQWFFPFSRLQDNSIETIWYLPSFLIGSAAAALLPSWISLGTTLKTTIAWTALAAVVVVTPAFGYLCFGWPPSNVLINAFLYFSLVWALFTLSVLSSDNWLRRLFSTRIFTTIGAWSYSIYLLHWYFLITLSSWPNHYLAALIGVVTSISAGMVLHFAVERPSEQTRKWLRSRLETRFSSQINRSALKAEATIQSR